MEEILLIGEPKSMIINNKKYIFKLNDDKSVTIEESGRIFQTIYNNKMNNLPIEEEIIVIGKLTEIEIDGSFLFNSDTFKKFNQDEVKTLFTNINPSQMDTYNYVILEIKLNKTKIMELIHQLRRAKNMLEKIYINKKILYVGFINSKDLDKDISSKIGDLNIIIYGLKKNMFASRDMRKFYDWDTIKNVKFLSDELGGIKNELGGIKKEIVEVKKKMNDEVTDIKNKLDIISQQLSILLGKKRKREEINENKNDKENDKSKEK